MSVAGFSLWLLPEASTQAELTALVQELAPQFGQPAFIPHVTVQGDLLLDLAMLTDHARALAASTDVQNWPVDTVESTENFFRALYLRFADSPAFAQLLHQSERLTGTATGLSPYPHLSLAYGALPSESPLLARLTARFTGTAIRFDRLAICRSSKDIPIADWDCVVTLPLKPTRPA